jgi:hypothetical protein
MDANTKNILQGKDTDDLTLDELAEAVKYLAKFHKVSVDGQAFNDGDGTNAAELSDEDLHWCCRHRSTNHRKATDELLKRRRAKRNNNT